MSKMSEDFKKIYDECVSLGFKNGYIELHHTFEKHTEDYEKLIIPNKPPFYCKIVKCSACKFFSDKTVDRMSDEELLKFCKVTIEKYKDSIKKDLKQ